MTLKELIKNSCYNRNRWIVYANAILLLDIEDIAEQTGLAESTIKNYLRKFADLLDEACDIFDKYYFKPKKEDYSNRIIYEVDPLNDVPQKCYLFRFYDENNCLVCSKVGTTTRTVEKRAKEELSSKTYKNCKYIVVDRVYNCQDVPAEGLESRIRAEYILKYPNSFHKNDRFIDTLFDLVEIDKIASNYIAESAKNT